MPTACHRQVQNVRCGCNQSHVIFVGTSPFLCLHMGSYPLIFSDFEKLVSFLDAQVQEISAL